MKLVAVLILLVPACADDPEAVAGLDFPELTPPVREAAPAALGGSAKPSGAAHLVADDLATRFFENGPTDIYAILEGLDARIGGVNDHDHPCKTATPVDFTIEPFGESVAMKASCLETIADGMFAQIKPPTDDDPTGYLYEVGPGGHRAAIITPVDGGYEVDAWLTMGYDSATVCGSFDCGSYGAIRVHANSGTGAFEMAVAGVGFGYCGAQLRSDTASVYAVGSTDMGATCEAETSLCGDGADLNTAGACDDLMTFSLDALGRDAGMGANEFGATQYPATPNITLDGTDTDDIHFGPNEPVAGTTEYE